MIKGYKIRIYPTKEQERKMWQHINCCRFIWNYMLAKQLSLLKNNEQRWSKFTMIGLITHLRNNEFPWLSEVSHKSLSDICSDLDKSLQLAFSKKNKMLKFKSKKTCKTHFPICSPNFYFKDLNVLNIEKIGKVKYKTDLKFPIGIKVQKFNNARVSFENNKWFVSFGLNCENQAQKLTDYSMGIDLGVKNLCIVEYNGMELTFNNINKSKKMIYLNNKLKHVQRNLARKYLKNKQGKKYIKTKNILKEEIQFRKLHSRIANIRHNYIHQTTHKLTSLLPKRIVMEDLNISGMMKNHHLSRAIKEQCFYEFTRQMRYKCEWNGIDFVQADRFFPSSKLCSNCGCVKESLKLCDRTYVCEHCGNIIDRDYNAAINLSRYVA